MSQGEEFYIRAFWDLDTCRTMGFALGPIPWDRIRDYAAVHQLDEDLIEPFIRIIRELDKAFLEWEATEAERRSKQRSGNIGNQTREKR